MAKSPVSCFPLSGRLTSFIFRKMSAKHPNLLTLGCLLIFYKAKMLFHEKSNYIIQLSIQRVIQVLFLNTAIILWYTGKGVLGIFSIFITQNISHLLLHRAHFQVKLAFSFLFTEWVVVRSTLDSSPGWSHCPDLHYSTNMLTDLCFPTVTADVLQWKKAKLS